MKPFLTRVSRGAVILQVPGEKPVGDEERMSEVSPRHVPQHIHTAVPWGRDLSLGLRNSPRSWRNVDFPWIDLRVGRAVEAKTPGVPLWPWWRRQRAGECLSFSSKSQQPQSLGWAFALLGWSEILTEGKNQKIPGLKILSDGFIILQYLFTFKRFHRCSDEPSGSPERSWGNRAAINFKKTFTSCWFRWKQ